jgi:hypothetical protein
MTTAVDCWLPPLKKRCVVISLLIFPAKASTVIAGSHPAQMTLMLPGPVVVAAKSCSTILASSRLGSWRLILRRMLTTVGPDLRL